MPSIHILDDDSLLNTFRLCRPVLLDEDEGDDSRVLLGGEWARERWWYQLTHVCQRWRHLILASASHLGLCLVCTYGTPVADMLAHSPPLPIVVDHIGKYHGITKEDEAGIMLALQHRDRVRRIRLDMPLLNLKRFVVAIDGEFPVLEYLYVAPPIRLCAKLVLAKTFRAPRLRHLVLATFAVPIGAPLLIADSEEEEEEEEAGLVTLALESIPLSAYFGPDELLRRLLLMQQLERLVIHFDSPVVPKGDVVHGQPIMTHAHAVTLANLRSFTFRGVSADLEALLPRLTAPRLEKLHIGFFNQLTYSLPCLVRFISATENLAGRLGSAVLRFNTWDVSVVVYPRVGARTYALFLCIQCRRLDWQVATVARALSALCPVLSAVVHLSLEFPEMVTSLEWYHEADRAEWRKLLEAFRNVKTLSVHGDLVWEISHALQLLDDGEPTLGLVPELDRLEFHGSGDGGDAFAPFIEARNNAGRPVTLVAL